MVRICIQLLQISIECFQFVIEWLESLSNCSNLHLIASNLVQMLPISIQNPCRMVPICTRLLQIPFKCFQFPFKWLESLSNGSNLDSIALNLVRMLSICIQMVGIPLEWFKFAFDCFKSRLNALNLLWNR